MRLINADKLDEEVMNLFITITGNPKQNTVVNECKSSFRRMIDEQPTIEAAPVVHGEWVDDSIESVWVRHKCSVCGFSKIMENRTVHDWSYCPNCGAKMAK